MNKYGLCALIALINRYTHRRHHLATTSRREEASLPLGYQQRCNDEVSFNIFWKL